ncbi:MAG: O-antigen ligase family protein [Mariprofundaceae bacterium]|nr:O-antigen ligase family protein [Mariprofundaceae bacterium]
MPYLLCAATIALPFSIAVANILFVCSLFIAFTSGLWSRGAGILWQQAKPLTIAWFAYIILMLIGLIWSPDIQRGLVIISKQWSWLIIPVFIAACENKTWQNRILFSISTGLFLHLLLCIAQSQGIPLPVAAPGGSSVQDPAGLIGHISFGLVYGIWAAWLLHIGMLKNDKMRYMLWALAAFSTMWVFIVQGRSGYLVVLTLGCIMAWKLWIQHMNPRLIFGAVVISILAITTIAMGPAKNRIQSTVDSLHAFSQGDLQHAEARISLWYLAWESWKTKPLIGVGTGGFPNASDAIAARHPNLNLEGQTHIAVPHNIYLMELVRWGPLGLVILLLFLSCWIRMGWRVDWQQPHHLLIAISGIALSVHGLSSQAIEEYHASVYTAIFLAVGLASLKYKSDVSLFPTPKKTSHIRSHS